MHETVNSIFRSAFQAKLIDPSKLNRKQRKAFDDICKCKTLENGLHIDRCDSCGHELIHYNSCKNPCCPLCQAVEKEIWSMKQEFYVLNTHYFHVVFTLPSEINTLALIDPKLVYTLLFDCSAETLKQLSEDPQYLGAKIGFTSVLHTWGSNLSLHPHVHCVVSGGGTDRMGRWKSSKKKSFIPVKVHVIPEGEGVKNDLLRNGITKKPMKDPSHVIRYLSRYTHRIAISNQRIISYTDGIVTFRYKDYRDHSKLKEMSLTVQEFFRRFMMHVPPHQFMRIRHYGFLGNRNKDERMKLLRSLTNTPDPGIFKLDMVKVISRVLKKDVSICPCCGNLRHPLLE